MNCELLYVCAMKRQDILILVWLCLQDKKPSQKEISEKLDISRAAVSYAIERCIELNLLDRKKYQVRKQALLEFIFYGLPYIYPAVIGSIVKGIPTGVSAFPLNQLFSNEPGYVWATDRATHTGINIEPLYPSIPAIVLGDARMYEACSLIDAIRIGHTRERVEAYRRLKEIIK
ncbi:MAG: winged helix-turn-helix transcriptional regulator [Saprospiraceae bacterium]|jgi:DNA-binding Lrp family transcriptional regulator|nr:winged helix-turn-helix transcriptional regulator [Saprospiraceae bacterium]